MAAILKTINEEDSDDEAKEDRDDETEKDVLRGPNSLSLSQYRITGMKTREKSEKKVGQESSQLPLKDAFAPVTVKELSSDQNKKAPRSLMFLKEKRDGKPKDILMRMGENNKTPIRKNIRFHQPSPQEL